MKLSQTDATERDDTWYLQPDGKTPQSLCYIWCENRLPKPVRI